MSYFFGAKKLRVSPNSDLDIFSKRCRTEIKDTFGRFNVPKIERFDKMLLDLAFNSSLAQFIF